MALTGASGLIGSAVFARLSQSHRIVAIGRRDDSELRADLSDPASVAQLNLHGADTLVHCAGVVDEDFADTTRAFRQATQGMAVLVARASACGVSRALYISSAHIYGPFVGTISEQNPPNPLSDYAIAHFASEQILRRASGPDLRAMILRPCAVFGIPPDLAAFRRWNLIPFSFPRSLVETGRIELKSSGAPRRNFVGASDIADGVARWLATSDEGPPCRVVNPVGKESMSVWEFAQLCARGYEAQTGKKAVLSRPVTSVAADDFEYVSCDSRYAGSSDLGETIGSLMNLLVGGSGSAGGRA